MRRTAATHMRDAGIPLDVIQRQLGHANIATTQAYLAGRATRDHLQRVSEWGADVVLEPVTPAHELAEVPAGDVLALADLAAARYVELPLEVREVVSAADYIGGTLSAWSAAAAGRQ